MKNIDKIRIKGLPKIGRYLVNNGSFVKLRETRLSKKYQTHDGYVFWELDGETDLELLKLTNAVKKDAEKWFVDNQFVDNPIDTSKLPKPSYWKLNLENGIFQELQTKKDGINRKVIKMDVTQAYWTTAKKVFLSEKTYLLGEKSKKKNRLKSLGALATNYEHKIYQEYEIVDRYNERKTTAFLFFYCAQIVDDLMKQLMIFANDYADFYWTDCIVLNSKNPFLIQSINKICLSHGYKIKYEENIFNYRIDDDMLVISQIENNVLKPYLTLPTYGNY